MYIRSDMDKKFLVILGVIVLGFVGFIVFNKKDSGNNTPGTSTASVSNNSVGAGNKKVTIIEYADFQCPACGQYYLLVKQIKEKYGDDITFTFRNFPLDSIHPNARAGHRAAESAGNQGKFFEMHNLIYENQQSWSTSTNVKTIFDTYAKQLNLDMDKFNSDFISEDTNATINADIDEGKSKGVNSTPTFFMNGTKLNNDDIRSVDLFSSLIDAEIAKSTASQAPADSTNPAQ